MSIPYLIRQIQRVRSLTKAKNAYQNHGSMQDKDWH